MNDGNVSSRQVTHGVVVENDVWNVIDGQDVVGPRLMEIHGHHGVCCSEHVRDFPSHDQARDLNAKQLNHGPVLVMLNQAAMVDAADQASTFDQTLDSQG